MEECDAALMLGVQFIFDPIAKTAMIIRDEETIAVPGRFDNYDQAHTACLRVVRAKYVDAHTRV